MTALLPRADGTLLIGTQDHGWNVWDGHGFSAPVARRDLKNTTIHAILDDGARASVVCDRQRHCALRLR